MKTKITDDEILRQLVNQVQVAANGQPETMVTTFITKPMWRAFLRGTGTNPNSKPTEWLGSKKTVRVYGSHTIVLKSKKMFSCSFSMNVTKNKATALAFEWNRI